MKFSKWAMKVKSRPWAAASVCLHRLQRMTVHGPAILHRAFRTLEWRAWDRAIVGPGVFN